MAISLLTACGNQNAGGIKAYNNTSVASQLKSASDSSSNRNVTVGTEEYRGFSVDNILHSETLGDIHFNLYVPKSYDGSEAYAVFITLPGYQGLYFQGVAENIKTESFGFEAQRYNENMIVVAPQLEDWGETSANKTIELTEYFLSNYNIDTEKVFINGYSGGGETLSLVLAKRPELFTAALMCASKWDGSFDAVVKNHTPVYFVIGEADEYYGSEPFKKAYKTLFDLYRSEGLPDNEISKILVLDIKNADYFKAGGVTYQHGGGGLFAAEKSIMEWLFNK